MNITKMILAFAISGLLLTSCKDSAKGPEVAGTEKQATDAKATAGKMETASFSIEGMTCKQGCAQTIEKELSSLDGVSKATIDYENKTATVEFDASKQSTEKLVEVVEDSGDGRTYKVTNVKSSGDHAMMIDPEKIKEKKAKKAAKKAKKEGCAMDTKEGAKPACCSAKKS